MFVQISLTEKNSPHKTALLEDQTYMKTRNTKFYLVCVFQCMELFGKKMRANFCVQSTKGNKQTK